MQQDAIAGRLKNAAETFLSGLTELCDDESWSMDKVLGDIVTATPARKRKCADEDRLQERFKALDELWH